ncbi:MAG: hypothetical protein KKC05_01485, partial [Nanoarchaeota archaeon]|nr:hypothetical protein [Nanoarchaeota archaeon]
MRNSYSICFLVSFVILSSLFFSGVSAQASVEKKLNEIVHYAEEYEIGNINYMQFNVYSHAVRADLNLMLGGGINENWGGVTQNSIEDAFGKATEQTYWIWVENEYRDRKLDKPLPKWEKIIFDGKKVQILLHANPYVIEEDGKYITFYGVNFDMRFKKEMSFDMNAIVAEVQALANNYVETGTGGEDLVKKMTTYQRLIERYVHQFSSECIDIFSDFFSADEKWPEYKTVRWESNIYSGNDFIVKLSVEMCDENCEFHWVSMNVWVDGRSPEWNQGPKGGFDDSQREAYKELSRDEVAEEIRRTLQRIVSEAEEFDRTRSNNFPGNYMQYSMKLETLAHVLDEKYNDNVAIEKIIEKAVAGEIDLDCDGWFECHKYCNWNNNVRECSKYSYADMVSKLKEVFSDFDIKEIPMSQIQFEKKLHETLMDRSDSWCAHLNDIACTENEGCWEGQCVYALGGDETCDNGVDDDQDNIVDCNDPDCYTEKECGKMCEDVCNREGGCWRTMNDRCSSVCKECWECGGDESCRDVCEDTCWACHDSEEMEVACDDCWTCEDDAYGGCYSKCKPCQECDEERKSSVKEIFLLAETGEIDTPGNCMSEEECDSYCKGLDSEQQ